MVNYDSIRMELRIMKAATVEGPAQVLKYSKVCKFAENVKYILTSIYGAPKILFHGALPL